MWIEDENTRKKMGQRLRSIRKRKGLTWEDIPKKGIRFPSASMVATYERGEHMVDGMNIMRICSALNTDIRALYENDYDGSLDNGDTYGDLYNERDDVLIGNFARNLYFYRTQHKFTHRKLAEAMGDIVTYAAISYYESGQRIPRGYNLYRLCVALNISVFSLFANEPPVYGPYMPHHASN